MTRLLHISRHDLLDGSHLMSHQGSKLETLRTSGEIHKSTAPSMRLSSKYIAGFRSSEPDGGYEANIGDEQGALRLEAFQLTPAINTGDSESVSEKRSVDCQPLLLI